jgi:hypothetical protein
MITTPELIRALAAQATPVRRLRPPAVRALLWLALAAIVIALLAQYHGLRPDLAERLGQASFLIQVSASLLTGVTSAVAAFQIGLPDRSRAWLLLPLPGMVLWISGIGYGCLTNWIAVAGGRPMLDESLRCLETIVLTSLPLSLALMMMLRRAGPLQPTLTAGVGALAVAALAATSLSLLHDIDATLLVIVWNFGTVALIVAAGGIAGRSLLSLRTAPSASR